MAEPKGAGELGGLHIDRARLKRRRRWLWRIVPAILLLVAGIIAVAVIASRPTAVAVALVRQARPGEAETVLSATGYVTSRRRSVVAPKIPGRLDEVLVDEGQRVNEGDVLARLDDADARVALLQAEARVRAVEAQRIAAEATLAQAERDLVRSKQLFAQGAIARLEIENAATARQTAREQVAALAGQIAAAEAAAAESRLRLDYTVIRAPFAATVVRKLADEGAVLAPASITERNVGGIVEIVDLEALEIDAEVSEVELRRVRRGQPALVELDAFPGVVHRAVARSVRPSIDRSKATAVVKVEFVDRPAFALPDMSVKVSFLAREVDPRELAGAPRLRVPASAVVRRDGRDVVMVVEGGRVEARPVEVERRVGDEVALASGPPAGTSVAAAPPPDLHAGARVRVKETPK